jgi:hypothetical protein
MPKSELVLVREPITNDTLLHTPKNDTLLEITDFTITAKPMQIIQIPTTKTLEIILVRVNANKLFRVFAHFNYKI